MHIAQTDEIQNKLHQSMTVIQTNALLIILIVIATGWFYSIVFLAYFVILMQQTKDKMRLCVIYLIFELVLGVLQNGAKFRHCQKYWYFQVSRLSHVLETSVGFFFVSLSLDATAVKILRNATYKK